AFNWNHASDCLSVHVAIDKAFPDKLIKACPGKRMGEYVGADVSEDYRNTTAEDDGNMILDCRVSRPKAERLDTLAVLHDEEGSVPDRGLDPPQEITL